MIQTLNLACDNSTLAHFKAWAQSISAWFATAGWLQSSDTGQVDWTTISAVPSVNAYVYEIWEPNDGLTNFYLKVEYGTISTNSPTLRLSIGTGTNGAGSLSGDIIGPFNTAWSSFTPDSVNLFPCYFSGAPGRISVVLWRGGPSNSAQIFSVERSVTNSSGAYDGRHVTLIAAGAAFNNGHPYRQQTLLFGVGAAPPQSTNISNNVAGGLAVRAFFPGNTSASSDFDEAVPFDTTAPFIGYFDIALTSIGWGNTDNYTDGQIFTTTLYGASRTYVATSSSPLQQCGPFKAQGLLCVRYD